MLGFSPVGNTPLGALPVIDIAASQTLSLTATPNYGHGGIVSQTLTITPSNNYNYNVAAGVSQTLTITPSNSYDKVWATYHTITFNQTHAYVGPGDLSHQLTLLQSVDVNVPYNFSLNQSLSFSHSLQTALGLNPHQTLSITQTPVFNIAKAITISDRLFLGHIVSVSTPAQEIGHSLLIRQTVGIVIPIPLSASQSLSFSQALSMTMGIPLTQNLTLVQSNIYQHSVPQTISQSLSLIQGIVYSPSVAIVQSLTLAQSNVCFVPLHVDVSQTLTLTDSNNLAQGLSVSQVLTFSEVLSAPQQNNITLTDSLILVDQVYIDPLYNLRQLLMLSQRVVFGRAISQAQSLTLTQSNTYTDLLTINQSLTITPSLSTVWMAKQSIAQALNLQQTLPGSGASYTFLTEQNIDFTQSGILNFDNYIAICQCVLVKQLVANYIPILITQQLHLLWTEKDVVYQTLHLHQLIETNYDDISCCAPFGINDGGDGASRLSLAQIIGCATTYNCSITHVLNIRSSATWRP